MVRQQSTGRHRPSLLAAVATALGLYAAIIAILAATDSLAAVHGWPATLAVSFGILCVLVLVGCLWAHPSTARTVVGVVAAALAVVTAGTLLTGAVPHTRTDHSPAAGAHGPSQLPTAPTTQSSSARTTSGPTSTSPAPHPSATGVSISNNDACGPTADVRPLPPVQVCVVYWCKGDVVLPDGDADPRHIQIKIRPQIINDSAQPLSIQIGKPAAIRLLVRSSQLPGEWGAPPNTAAAGDRPVLVTWNGSPLWAVPPNVNHDAAPTPSGEYTGFATMWTQDHIPPGSSYFSPLTHTADGQPNQTGDLVFQLPLDRNGQIQLIGLAVVTRTSQPTVLAVAPRTGWPQPSQPSSF